MTKTKLRKRALLPALILAAFMIAAFALTACRDTSPADTNGILGDTESEPSANTPDLTDTDDFIYLETPTPGTDADTETDAATDVTPDTDVNVETEPDADETSSAAPGGSGSTTENPGNNNSGNTPGNPGNGSGNTPGNNSDNNNPGSSGNGSGNSPGNNSGGSAEEKDPRFVTDYVEAGKPIKVTGYASGTKLEWIITNQATGKKTTKTTTAPQLTLTKADAESVITVRAEGYRDISIYYSSLPIVYVTSSTKFTGAGRSYYTAELNVVGDSGGFASDFLYSGKAELKLRGNSTAGLNKKSFKLKLDKKANLLGIDEEGKSKQWVLLANGRDPSLMRNKLLMDFSGAIGTVPYMASENVTLIYNGEYCGVYQLAEHVRVGETRVDIFDWEEYAEDAAKALAEKLIAGGTVKKSDADKIEGEIEAQMLTDWSWMKSGSVTYKGKTYRFTDLGLDAPPAGTGGFLLEMDFYSFNDTSLARTQTAYAQPLYFNTPEPVGSSSISSFMSTDLYNYAYNYVQSFEYAVHSDDFYFRNSDTHYYAVNWWEKGRVRFATQNYTDNENDGKHYSEMFDMDSLVRNFIFCEIAMNWDSMKNSFFLYKDINRLAMIGPQWDFDWAWGNDVWPELYNMGADCTWYPMSWHCREQVFMREQFYQEVQWNTLLIRDPYFMTKVWEMWDELRDDEIEELVGKGGRIDTYADYIAKAAAANDARWAKADAGGHTFDDSTARLKKFVSQRMGWLDGQFGSVDTLVDSLGVYHASGRISKPTVTVGKDTTTITVDVTSSWWESLTAPIGKVKFQINGTTVKEAKVSGNRATVTVNNSELDGSGYNCVVAYACDNRGKYVIDQAHSVTGNYNQVVSNYRAFKLK